MLFSAGKCKADTLSFQLMFGFAHMWVYRQYMQLWQMFHTGYTDNGAISHRTCIIFFVQLILGKYCFNAINRKKNYQKLAHQLLSSGDGTHTSII